MKYYGQFDIPVDKFMFERYFPDIGIGGVFVECGAFDGQTESSCRFFEESLGWTGFNLEPVPWIFDQLCINRPKSRNFQIGLSDQVGVIDFECVIHPTFGRYNTLGSVDLDADYKLTLEGAGCSFEKIQIEVITWDSFVNNNNINSVDICVLDVEGHELSVLKGFTNSRVKPHVMCVEFGHVGFPLLRGAMEALGYVYDISSFANAFFIRADLLPLFVLRGLHKREY